MRMSYLKIHKCIFLINRVTQREHPEVKGSQIVVKVVQGNEPPHLQREAVAGAGNRIKGTKKRHELYKFILRWMKKPCLAQGCPLEGVLCLSSSTAHP